MVYRKIGVGLLGYSSMGKAHSFAYKVMPHFFWPPPAIPELVTICGRTESRLKAASENFGFKKYTTDWREMVRDEQVEVVDNSLPNDMHHDVTISALEAGKHVLCEKPLARNSLEAKEMWEASCRTSAKAMVAFNYRFVPAVLLARELIKSRKLGRIYHFRARYLQQWLADPSFPLVWRLVESRAGSGPIGDLGSHIVDLARFMVGEVTAVTAVTRTFVKERPLPDDPSTKGPVTVEDAFAATVEFDNGAIGTLEASRCAAGRKNYNNFEVNGENGSIEFNLERLNELRFFSREGDVKTLGWNEILATDKVHDYTLPYRPHGDALGWNHTFVSEVYHFIDAIVNDKEIGPIGATFEDGYRNNVILDAILKSAKENKRVNIRL